MPTGLGWESESKGWVRAKIESQVSKVTSGDDRQFFKHDKRVLLGSTADFVREGKERRELMNTSDHKGLEQVSTG